MAEKKDRKGLGRGLSALLADVDAGAPPAASTQAEPARRPDDILPIEKVRPNPKQPRRAFSDTDLNELSASIAEKGILQPLIVRKDPEDPSFFQIVAGERRWRAAQKARLHEVPVLIREFDDTEALEVAIVENIQRSNLNAIEEAMGYRQLMDSFGHTQEKLAEALGKSRSHIANFLRMLNLPDSVVDLVRDGKLSAGHARALVTADAPEALAKEVVARGLSVRQTEALAKKKPEDLAKPDKPQKDADTRALEQDLTAQLGIRVTISHKPDGGGDVKLTYKNLEQLDGICQLLSSTQN